MATSAFRSTTRRSDCAGKAEVSGGGLLVVPSTPTPGDGRRSRRDPSPSPGLNNRGGGGGGGRYGGGRPSSTSTSFHRRSSSMSADFSSAKYLSDCSSSTALRSASSSRNHRNSSGPNGGPRSTCPSDSESDMECLSAHRPLRKFGAESEDERQPRRRWGADSEDERNVRPPFSTLNAVDRQSKGLRRASSSHDFSQYNNKQRHSSTNILVKKDEHGDAEDLAEEKTIRAVFAQMKSLQSDPPVGDGGMNDFLDAMRSEVKRAVADIRMELEESMRKNGNLASTLGEENGAQGTDVTLAVLEIRKEYSTKLEESEKRVQELWSQIAVEERRCIELSKIVKELLPTPPPPTANSGSHVSSNRRRPLRRKNSSEKQHVLKTLDDEAQKYFDECVSISSLDCPADSDDSMREKENKSRQRKGRSGDTESTAKSGSAHSEAKGGPSKKDVLIGSDGVVLPWLQWEAEAAGGNDNSPSQGLRKHHGKSTNSSVFDRLSPGANGRNTNIKSNMSRKPGASRSLSEALQIESFVEPLFAEYKATTMKAGNKSSMTHQTGKSSSASLFTVDDNMADESYPLIDGDALFLEKIRFRCRIENGELLLCQGLFLM